MADVNRGNRPLSPHLQVYRLPLTAVTSIMNRVTGIALVAGLVLLTWWLVGISAGGRVLYASEWVLRSWLGFLIMVGSLWALWFHFLGGLRHLIYDSGLGLEIEQAHLLSQIMLIGSAVLTLISVVLFFI